MPHANEIMHFLIKLSFFPSILLMTLTIMPANVRADCKPSDPFGNNIHNICPQGFAFSFTQNFEQPNYNYVLGEYFSGQPIQPGIPGKLQETLKGFYTSVNVSGGTTTITTSEGETIVNGVTQ